jgi:hypothetical protein
MLIVVPAAWGTLAAIMFGGLAAYRGWVDWRIAMDERKAQLRRMRELGIPQRPSSWPLAIACLVVLALGVGVSIAGAMHG